MEEMELLLDTDHQKTDWIDTLKGFTGMMVSVTTCVVSFASGQLLERAIPDNELNAMRNAAAALCYLLYLVIRRIPLQVPKDELWVIASYGLFVFLESMSVYIAVTFIPVAHVDALKMTSSLLLGLVLFAMCLGEKLTVFRVVFALLCIFGIVCVIQPDFIFMEVETTKNVSANLTSFENRNIKTGMAYCLAVIGGFGYIWVHNNIQKKNLHNRKHHFSVILVLLVQLPRFSYHNGGSGTSGFTRNVDAIYPGVSTQCWICV